MKIKIIAFIIPLFSVSVFAQTGIIKGSIKSAKNQPLIGINVGLEGTTLGSPTDNSGNFIIKNVPAGT
jgi:iron complex outermembrane receptor protein